MNLADLASDDLLHCYDSDSDGTLSHFVFQSLPGMLALRTLHMRDCKFTADDAVLLALCLQHAPSLSAFSVPGNDLADAGTHLFASHAPEWHPLEYLYLSGNDVTGSAPHCSGIALLLQKLPALVELDLHGNRLGKHPTAMQALANAVSAHRCLLKLDLDGNVLTDECGPAIASMIASPLLPDAAACTAFKACPLNRLLLGSNKFGDEFVATLSQALKRNTTLTFLALFHNNLTNASASSLSEALTSHRSLRTLDLGESRHLDQSGWTTLLRSISVGSFVSALSGAAQAGPELYKQFIQQFPINAARHRTITARVVRNWARVCITVCCIRANLE
jgi:Ran GTPase-activating protein (RanGAP) involved in mRNA processing and transport